MKLQNNLFLVLFNSKPEPKWESWKRFAHKNNYLFSILKDPLERPIVRGLIQEKPVCIELVHEGYFEKQIQLKIKSPIYNPKEYFLLIQNKNFPQNHTGIFYKSIQGVCSNKKLEEKFTIKTNSERLPSQILNNPTLSQNLLSEEDFSIEINGYEVTLTSYNLREINKEFINLLKLFYSFLTNFEQLSLTATNIKK